MKAGPPATGVSVVFLGVGLDAHVKGDAVCRRMAMQRQVDRSM
ncbi:hypothetical protein MM1S1520914_0057 [Mycobacteroides abscessus subsp. bolletii 1S-152-0914]|nr:hypothetical protein MM1S1520914_0057 [Mycobacteroides abscessus subsp. bolletii 1S-152-0914]SLF12556.1 Uncharacterised protein [Mycobacteroides abscessus subsp. massiliense]